MSARFCTFLALGGPCLDISVPECLDALAPWLLARIRLISCGLWAVHQPGCVDCQHAYLCARLLSCRDHVHPAICLCHGWSSGATTSAHLQLAHILSPSLSHFSLTHTQLRTHNRTRKHCPDCKQTHLLWEEDQPRCTCSCAGDVLWQPHSVRRIAGQQGALPGTGEAYELPTRRPGQVPELTIGTEASLNESDTACVPQKRRVQGLNAQLSIYVTCVQPDTRQLCHMP